MYKLSLKERRKALGKTMKQVAKETGVNEATVSRWESGGIKEMRSDKIMSLAKALEMSPMDLLFDTENYEDFNKNKDKIPLIGTVACGLPILAEENIEDYMELPCNIKADFCLRCKGDSMINARINDGDIVFIKKCEDVENGEIAVVLIENEATLKRVYKYPDYLLLQAENPNYKPIIISGSELERVRIEGRAVYFLSALI